MNKAACNLTRQSGIWKDNWLYLQFSYTVLLKHTINGLCSFRITFDVCVTVYHWYNYINSQLDATITNFVNNYNQLNMFRTIISPILRSTRLCLQLVVYCTDDAACWWQGWHQQAASSVYYTTSCKHSLVLLRMGEIIARNMLSWL